MLANSYQAMAEGERTLVLRAAKRDTEAFTRLYDRFVDKIYKYVYYRVGSTDLAEDLTSQVFLKAWMAIQNYRCTDRPFSAWLFRIAHNLIVDHFRTQHPSLSIDELPLADESVDDADELAQSHLTAETLRKALKRLTQDQQQVIILKFLEGYGTEELATIMGKHPGAVRALQHRGLLALQRILKKDYVLTGAN